MSMTWLERFLAAAIAGLLLLPAGCGGASQPGSGGPAPPAPEVPGVRQPSPATPAQPSPPAATQPKRTIIRRHGG